MVSEQVSNWCPTALRLSIVLLGPVTAGTNADEWIGQHPLEFKKGAFWTCDLLVACSLETGLIFYLLNSFPAFGNLQNRPVACNSLPFLEYILFLSLPVPVPVPDAGRLPVHKKSVLCFSPKVFGDLSDLYNQDMSSMHRGSQNPLLQCMYQIN